MNYGLYVSAAGLQAQEKRQAVIANNIANASNTGFKRDLVVMQTRANAVDEDPAMAKYRLPVLMNQGGGVFAVTGGIDLSQGLPEKSSADTDVALQGPGFFTVAGDEPGQKLLTRDGQFLLDNDGGLVMANSGRAVLGADGQPIKLNPTLPVIIDGKGTITQGDSSGGPGVSLGIVDVSDPRRLMKQGRNLMTVKEPATLKEVDSGTMVRQRELEASGTDPMIEMVNMMEGQRAFDANAKMITFQDTTLSQLNTIGRVA